jgi:signal transduction histidine kinase
MRLRRRTDEANDSHLSRGKWRSLISRSPLDRATILRHLALSGAALATFVMRRQLRVDTTVLWVLGVAAVANMVAARLSDIPSFSRPARWVSSVLGIGGWAALVLLTGGISSPLVAGFWLEIVFSAMVFPPAGTLAVSAGATAALWAVDATAGAGHGLGLLALQTAFVVAIGLLTFFASRRWRQDHQTLSVQAGALNRRLSDLEQELEAARTLGQVGERVARLAHSLTNTVHSLRGFSKLIEAPLLGSDARREALDGLRLAIDRLEETARATLRATPKPSHPEVEPSAEATTAAELGRTLDAVITEVARDHVGIRWIKPVCDRLPNVGLPSDLLHEVLLILARNAAEASGESGEVVLRADVDAGALHLVVEDHGPGIDPLLRGTLFRPGATTKPTGSGFGLFLARRLVESRGGKLFVGQAVHGGACVSVRLPTNPS